MMRRTRPRHARGPALHRRAIAAGSALALTLGAGVAAVAVAAPAQADTTVTSGSLGWGYKASFRTYVGNQLGAIAPIGPAAIGARIVPQAPAAFSPAVSGTPTTTAEETRPYSFPVTSGGEVTATAADVATTGGVQYNFPSHGFEYRFSNVRVSVSGGNATVRADTYLNATMDFGDVTAGEVTGNQIVIAQGAGAISVAADGGSATVSATGLTFVEGATDYAPQAAGDAMDDLSLTVALEDPAGPQEPNGQVIVSKTSGLDAEGDTVTVTGTGFLPTVLGTRPPLSGKPTGVYVVFGKFAANWQPTAGAPSSARVGLPAGQGGTKWAVLAADMATIGGDAAGAIELTPEGTFTATLSVKEDWGVSFPADGAYGIYTYGGGGGNHVGYETFTPISFATTTPEPGEDEQLITATMPEQPGGEFSWTIDATDRTVDLGTLQNKGAYYQATGDIKPVTVTDTRTNQANAWSISGQLSDFTGGLSGKYLGWTPSVVTAGAGATAGAAVASGFVSGDGLSVSQLLGSGADGHASGSGTLGAGLDLRVPADTAAGTYTATLTLTALS